MSERQNYIIKLADNDTYKIGDKSFTYQKITNAKFNELEKMKLQIRKEKDVEKGSELVDAIMRKSAEYFLGITTEYDELPREELGYAIEAATYRTLYGKPFLSQSSTTLPDSADK